MKLIGDGTRTHLPKHYSAIVMNIQKRTGRYSSTCVCAQGQISCETKYLPSFPCPLPTPIICHPLPPIFPTSVHTYWPISHIKCTYYGCSTSPRRARRIALRTVDGESTQAWMCVRTCVCWWYCGTTACSCWLVGYAALLLLKTPLIGRFARLLPIDGPVANVLRVACGLPVGS